MQALKPTKDFNRRVVVKNKDVLETSTSRFVPNEVVLRVELLGYRPITVKLTSKQCAAQIRALQEALEALPQNPTA